jgi:hypothetical protein
MYFAASRNLLCVIYGAVLHTDFHKIEVMLHFVHAVTFLYEEMVVALCLWIFSRAVYGGEITPPLPEMFRTMTT